MSIETSCFFASLSCARASRKDRKQCSWLHCHALQLDVTATPCSVICLRDTAAVLSVVVLGTQRTLGRCANKLLSIAAAPFAR